MTPVETRNEISENLNLLSEEQLIEVLNYVKHIQQQLSQANQQSDTRSK